MHSSVLFMLDNSQTADFLSLLSETRSVKAAQEGLLLFFFIKNKTATDGTDTRKEAR